MLEHPSLKPVRRVKLTGARSAFWRFHTEGVGEVILSQIGTVMIYAEGGHWAQAKRCSFLHERCNYSHFT
jgi:hypothetical protein